MFDKSSSEWQWGQWAEEHLASFLQEKGFWVFPLMNIERKNGAPLLLGRDGNRVLPDMQAVKAGKIILIESKWKACPDYFRIANSWRHGIDTVNWIQYQEIEKEMQVRCFLAFLEQRSERCSNNNGHPRLLLADFDTLRQYAIPSLPSNRYGDLTYWDIDRTPFKVFNAKSDGGPPVELPSKKIHPWEQPSRSGELPREKMLREKRQQLALF